MKNLLTIIDMQYDFVMPDGRLSLNCPEIIKPFNGFIKRTGGIFDAIIATRDDHAAGEYENCTYSDEAKNFPMHCEVGTKGHKYAVKIPASNKLSWISKKDNDMWHRASRLCMRPYAETFNGGMETNAITHLFSNSQWHVFIAGVASDICVKYAITGFLARGYKVSVLTDLTRGLNADMDAVAAQCYADCLRTGRLRLITSAEFIKENKRK